MPRLKSSELWDKWETKWTWLSKQVDKERGWCNICACDAGDSTSRFKEHEKTKYHKENSIQAKQESAVIRRLESSKDFDTEEDNYDHRSASEGRYNYKWEEQFKWLTKMKGKERGWCMFCETELGCHANRFTRHEKSYKHKRCEQVAKLSTKDVKRKVNFDPLRDIVSTIFDDYTPQTPKHCNMSTDQPATISEMFADSIGIEINANFLNSDVVDSTNIAPISVDVSTNIAPISGDVTMVPILPLYTLKANAQHHSWFQHIMCHALTTGEGYDVVWQCDDGGVFRVHKFVLAAFSTELRNILPDNEEEVRIFTPDLSKDMVEAILITMYTGQTVLSWNLLEKINIGFKTIGFVGKDMEANPCHDISGTPKVQISYSAARDRMAKQIFSPIKLAPIRYGEVIVGRPLSKRFHKERAVLSDFDTCVMQDNVEVIYDDNDDEVKVEVDEQDDKSWFIENLAKAASKKRKLNDWEKTHNKNEEFNYKRIKRDLDILMDKAVVTGDKIDIPIQQTSRNYRIPKETRTIFPVCRKNGVLSRNIPLDLIDDKKEASNMKVIVICPVCFQLFDMKEKYDIHKEAFHSDQDGKVVKWNQMILGNNLYHCKKCKENLKLQHLVWFIKHYKFCGVDDTKANEVLRVGDVEEQVLPPFRFRNKSLSKKIKKHPTECNVLYVLDKDMRKTMSRALLGKVNPAIWGCRKCYTAFDSETIFKAHVKNVHDGKIEHGSNFDAVNKEYFCQRCNIFRSKRTVISFIYHMKNCNVIESATSLDLEDGIDEDAYEEFVDPWGVINKPLKVSSLKAKWMSEALFNEIVDMIYPCHLCYSLFKTEQDIRDHFRENHAEIQNLMEDGIYYNRASQCFNCPHCRRDVCKKHANSISFIYHMRKCSNQLYPVKKNCTKCGIAFPSYAAMTTHLLNNCGTKNFVCHICTAVLSSRTSYLAHVKIVHAGSNFPCEFCDKKYKRKFELKMHIQKEHMGGQKNYKCDQCDKSFAVKKALQTHKQQHNATEADKKHICPYCPYRFLRKDNLTKHLATHSSVQRFQCDMCSTKTKIKSDLQTHRRRVHKLSGPVPEQCILNIGNEVTAPTITRNKNSGKMPQIFKPLPTTKAKKKYKRQMPAMLAGKRIPGVLIEAEVESDDDHSQIPIKEEMLPDFVQEFEL